MEEIKLTLNHEEIKVPMHTSVSACIEASEMALESHYDRNPIVGAFYNGRAVPLGFSLESDGVLEPIKVFDPIGRRIYRHSLCFLLFYSAHLLFKDRKLVIGHSLGDGFYFSFDDERSVSLSEVSEISAKMMEVVKKNLPIVYKKVPNEMAIEYFSGLGLCSTALLLSLRNEPENNVYGIDDFYDIAYEPLVPNTGILSVFELRVYGKGMLLRYPVSSDILHVAPEFRDNAKLFSIFEESKNWGKILEVSCAGEMDRKISDKSIGSYVRLAESLQRRKIAEISDKIFQRKVQAVFIAGPSSSGKTTFAKKICEQLQMLGCETIRISLDDYYRSRNELPKNAKGEPDYECLEALRVDLFHQNMAEIFEGKEVYLPEWSFSQQKQTLRKEAVKLTEKTVFVIEGIHGLNQAILSAVEEDKRASIYISALTQLNLDDHNRVSTTDNRIIRRLVRDYRTRAVSAVETLSMWSDVEKGERKYIFPNQNNADIMFNSALDYELGVLSPFAVPLLKEVSSKNKEAYSMARRLLMFLENFYAIPSKLIPSDSILREFIGDSDYE